MKTFVVVGTLIAAQQVAVAWPAIYPVSSGRHAAVRSSSSTTKTTSLHSMGGLLVRGGATIVEKSYYGDALGYFGGIRIPASTGVRIPIPCWVLAVFEPLLHPKC